jgi:hypothetical protein
MGRFIFLSVLVFFCIETHAGTFSFRCKFLGGQVTNFDNGTPSISSANDMDDLVFDQVDLKKKKARLIGNSGASTIQIFAGFDSIHLIENTEAGNLNLTTIFIPSQAVNSNFFPVVHSRHVQTFSGPLPSQYVGQCTRLR